MTNNNWEKVGGGEQTEEWKYKEATTQEEKTLVGKYVEKRINLGENKSTLYVIEKDDGELVSVWESTALAGKFGSAEIGDMVKIEYLGLQKTKTGGRTYHNFEFHKKSANAPAEKKLAENAAEDDTEAIFEDLP